MGPASPSRHEPERGLSPACPSGHHSLCIALAGSCLVPQPLHLCMHMHTDTHQHSSHHTAPACLSRWSSVGSMFMKVDSSGAQSTCCTAVCLESYMHSCCTKHICHCSIAKTMTAPTKRVWDVASEQCHYNAMEMMVVYVCAQVNTVYTNMQYKYIDIHVSDTVSMILYLDYCCLMGAIT